MSEQLELFVRPELPFLPAERVTELDCLLRIVPPKPKQTEKRRRLNFALVLDRSGSMQGPKLERARRAARYLIQQLQPDDRLAIVAYSDTADTLVSSQRVGDAKQFLEALDRIYPAGCTALQSGWVAGGMEVGRYLGSDRLSRVILLSDGMANIGETSPAKLVEQSESLFGRGISTTTIGISDAFNEDLLIPMALRGGGNAWFVQREDDFDSIFSAELSGMRTLYSSDATLEIQSGEVEVIDLYNDFEQLEPRRWRLPLLQGDSALHVVARLRVPETGVGVDRKLARFVVRANPVADGDAEVEREVSLTLHTVTAALAASSPAYGTVELHAARLRLARVHRQVADLLDAGSVDRAAAKLRRASEELRPLAHRVADDSFDHSLDALEQLRKRVEAKRDLAMSRKLCCFTALYLQRGRNPDRYNTPTLKGAGDVS